MISVNITLTGISAPAPNRKTNVSAKTGINRTLITDGASVSKIGQRRQPPPNIKSVINDLTTLKNNSEKKCKESILLEHSQREGMIIDELTFALHHFIKRSRTSASIAILHLTSLEYMLAVAFSLTSKLA